MATTLPRLVEELGAPDPWGKSPDSTPAHRFSKALFGKESPGRSASAHTETTSPCVLQRVECSTPSPVFSVLDCLRFSGRVAFPPPCVPTDVAYTRSSP